ncbi:MAG: hypothetical protein HUK21_04940 [Fibrobacteraceae bacterium]|nr:hypothetical protein [Fibrobacteraceae bacterium]
MALKVTDNSPWKFTIEPKLPRCEGIDISTKYGRTVVSINTHHEKGMDTSLKDKPIVEIRDIDGIQVKILSIFKRTAGVEGDGNPLIYALKRKDGYSISKEDRAWIENRAREIMRTFIAELGQDIFISIPSSAGINKMLLDMVEDLIPHEARFIPNLIRKISAGMVQELLYGNVDFYNKALPKFENDKELNDALSKSFSAMTNDTFERKKLDARFRGIAMKTMEIIPFFKDVCDMKDHDIVLIDDTISYGDTIDEACRLMVENFQPASVSVLTLCSSK